MGQAHGSPDPRRKTCATPLKPGSNRVFGVLIGEHLVPASVTDRLRGHGAVVVLVPDPAAAAGIEDVIDDEALAVRVAIAVASGDLAARGWLGFEGGSRTDHASPIDVAGIQPVQRPT